MSCLSVCRAGLLSGIVALSLFAASSDAAQNLFVGASGSSTVPAYAVDPDAATATVLWPSGTSNRYVVGAAADRVNGIIYTTTGARLGSWKYGSQPSGPTIIAGVYRYRPSDGFVENVGLDELFFANGNLYAWTDFASTNFTRGIYQVPTAPNSVSPTGRIYISPVWTDSNPSVTAFNIEGLTHNPANNLVYGFNSGLGSTGPGQPTGIYTIDVFGSGAITKIADAPVFNYLDDQNNPGSVVLDRIDGVALGDNNILYLSQHVLSLGAIVITSYDLTAGNYTGDFLTLDYNQSATRSTALTWAPGMTSPIPESSTLALVPLGTLFLRRRR